uniref:Zona pellucida sperm-binding protein 4-like n=2 Tax=Lepisosteus oculatus TaxID=7918 RepID=W5N5P8_LEPOC
MEKSGISGKVWILCVLLFVLLDVALAQNQKCLVSDNDKVVCGDPTVTRADCEAGNCCFDQTSQRRCYYGNDVTVQCTRDGQFVVVVSRNATSPPLSLDSVSLLGGGSAACGPVGTTAGFAM